MMRFKILLFVCGILQSVPGASQDLPGGVGPEPIGGPASLFRADDTPMDRFGHPHQGTVRFTLTINVQGIPTSCKIVLSSGVHDIDQVTCLAALGRGRFVPARDEHSNPIVSLWTWTTRWGVKHSPRENSSDLILTVKNLPEGTSLLVRLREIVDEKGRQESCVPDDTSINVKYAAFACKALAAIAGRAAKGESTTFVRTLLKPNVLFTTKPVAVSNVVSGQVYVPKGK
jgi:hypothetical protein